MKVTAALLIERLKASVWLIPAGVALFIVCLLFFALSIRPTTDSSLLYLFILHDASAEGARQVLGSIATSVMTVVGVLFSITIVVLQQASTQYAPRVVQNFVRSTPSQVVLGSYIGTFTYCILLLRQIQENGDREGPSTTAVAMSTAILLALVCLGLLIYYIHHITKAIQSTEIINRVTEETLESLKNMVSDRKEYFPRKPLHRDIYLHEITVDAKNRGYLQAIDWKSLRRALNEPHWYLEIMRSPGEYLQAGMPLLKLLSSNPPDPGHCETLNRRIRVGHSRTQAQDPEFGVRQLVDIGLRALSPGINDPTTAMEAVNGITAILLSYIEKHPIQCLMEFEDDRFLKIPTIDPENFVRLCYDQLIQFGETHLPVLQLIDKNICIACERSSDDPLRTALQRRQIRVRRYIAAFDE